MIPTRYTVPFERYSQKNPVPDHLRKRSTDQRAIYAIEFDDHTVIVGLTNDYLRRIGWYRRHPYRVQFARGKALVKLFCVWYPEAEAAIQEGIIVKAYRNAGWGIRNIRPTGGLGRPVRRGVPTPRRVPDSVPYITCYRE